MIEQNREMLQPGEGIVRDPGPQKQHEEFPRYMTHPAYRRGKPDKEYKVLNESGQEIGKRYMGGESIRFPPVLARSLADRDFHLSQGYVDNGKSDAAAFSRLVADAEPVQENYKPLEYPKYCFGKIVNDAAEEEARLIELNVNPDGSPREAGSETPAAEPAIDAEVNTLDVFPGAQIAAVAALAGDPESEEDEIAVLEAKLAVLKAKKDRTAQLKAEIAQLEAEAEPAAEPAEVTASADDIVQDAVAAEVAKEAPRKMTRGEKIAAGIARKKAERAANPQQEDKAA